MPPTVIYNAFEVVLWAALGVEFLRRSIQAQPPSRWRLLVASVAFLAFAGSDAMEMQTGAWWKPWWLFAWKAACVLTLVTLCTGHFIRKRRNTSLRTDPGSE